LVALDASMEIAGLAGRRSVPASEFFLGTWRTAVGPGELLAAITLPALNGAGVGYSSLQRAADSWAIARAAAWVRVGDGQPGGVEAVRVVLGCVAATPVRASATEQLLVGAAASETAVADAAAAAGEGLEPPSDAHASGSYRRAMAVVMAKRALLAAIGGAR
jgi:carbon-monoxide dehydrogenase medium subunit